MVRRIFYRDDMQKWNLHKVLVLLLHILASILFFILTRVRKGKGYNKRSFIEIGLLIRYSKSYIYKSIEVIKDRTTVASFA